MCNVGTLETFFSKFRDCDNIELRVTNFVPSIMIVARDMKESYGYIKAEHMLFSCENEDFMSVELSPDKDWYANYQLQIEEIWNRGKPFEFK
jgi:hypothetical protein